MKLVLSKSLSSIGHAKKDLTGRTVKYGPQNWPIRPRVLTEWYNKIYITTLQHITSYEEIKLLGIINYWLNKRFCSSPFISGWSFPYDQERNAFQLVWTGWKFQFCFFKTSWNLNAGRISAGVKSFLHVMQTRLETFL